MRMVIHFATSAMVLAMFVWPAVVRAKPLQFADQGVELTLTSDGANLVSLKIEGIETQIRGTEQSALWEVRVLDEPNRKRNDTPLRPANKKYYYFSVWQDSRHRISSRDARMVSHYWNASKHQLTLNYKHPLVNVSLRYLFSNHRLEMQAVVTNKGADPLSHVNVPLNWQLTYMPKQTLLVPHVGTGVEYANLKTKYPFWMCNAAWNGMLVNGPGNLLGLYRVQHQKGKPWLATEIDLVNVPGQKRTIAFRSGTVIYRKTGESVQTVTQSIGRYTSIRQYADEYLNRNFPDMKTLAEKVPADMRDTLASAVHLPVRGRFNPLAKIIKQLPGRFIIHPFAYMRPTTRGGNSQASFPNYFPPDKHTGGSMQDYTNFVQTVHQSGNLFLPRNSFFYWVDKSDMDQDGKLSTMAIRRINGMPRTAKWGLSGYLMSPSSRRVNQFLHQVYKQWKTLGADLYFTNVLGAMAPYGHRYDFHPDSPGPDLFYDQIKNMIAWHGKQIPMFTEGGGSWLLPYQVGYFNFPGWNPDKPNHSKFLYDGTRGEFLGFREEMQAYFTHQYAMTFPHNLGFYDVQNSPRKLTYSFLYGIHLKYGLRNGKVSEKSWRWLRTLGLLGKTVQKQLWGTRLNQFTRQKNGIERADYQGNIVIANFSKQPHTFTEAGRTHTIIPDGFYFRSKDGKLVAGWYSQFNKMQLRTPQLLVVQIDQKGQQQIFAPLAQQEVELVIPVNPSQSMAAFVQTDTQTEKPLPVIRVRDGLRLKLPPFDVGPGTFIPHVQLRPDQPVRAQAAPGDNLPMMIHFNNDLRVYEPGEKIQIHLRVDKVNSKNRVFLEYVIRDFYKTVQVSEKKLLDVTDSQANYQMDVPSLSKIGFFQIQCSLKNEQGDLIGHAKAHFAVIPPMTDFTDSKNNPFGAMVQPHGHYPMVAREKDARLMARIGMNWVRTHRVNWLHVQKGPEAALDWRDADADVALYQKYGLHIVATTCWPTPRWASDGKGSDVDWRTRSIMMPSEKYLPMLVEFCRKMALRYQGKISYYEIGNEVDAKNFWAGSLDHYLTGNDLGIMKDYYDFFVIAANAIRKADPSAKVAPGTTGMAPEGAYFKPWLKTMYEFGIAKTMNAFSTHYSADMDKILAVMNQYGHKPDMIFTEIGGVVRGAGNIDTLKNAKRMIQKTIAECTLQISKGAKVVCKYQLRDIPKYPDPQINGLLYPDFSLRPNYVAYATLIRNLAGTQFQKELNITHNSQSGWLQGFRFQKDGKDMNVIWLNDAKSSKTTFETESQQIELIDIMGNVQKLRPVRNQFEITLEKDLPIFIIGKIKDRKGAIQYPQDQLIKTVVLTLKNADFEAPGSSLNHIKGWRMMINEKAFDGKGNSDFEVFVDQRIKKHGQRSLTFKPRKRTQWWGVAQALPFDQIPKPKEGEYLIFEISHDLRAEKVDGAGASFSLSFRGENGLRLWNKGGDYRSGTFEWKRMKKELRPIRARDIPPKTKKVTLDLVLGKSTGQVWFDNVKVKVHLWEKVLRSDEY